MPKSICINIIWKKPIEIVPKVDQVWMYSPFLQIDIDKIQNLIISYVFVNLLVFILIES